MIYQGKARVPIREAILHCAAVPTGWATGKSPFQVFAEINRWHHERGFANGFGYHQLVMPDGEYYPGRPYPMVGAHCIGHNSGTIGILLIESRKIEHLGQFEEWFTEAQRSITKRLLAAIPGLEKVSGHNDYARKLCPGFEVHSRDWL